MTTDKSNYYFTKEHEESIIKYKFCEDIQERSKIYEEEIDEVLELLIVNIMNTYKFNDLANSERLVGECKAYLTTIIPNYDHERSAFTYFSAVVRNWFFAKAKKETRKSIRESSYDDIPKSLHEEELVTTNGYFEARELSEFLYYLGKEIDTWDTGHRKNLLGENDLKVVKAFRACYKNASELEMLNKKGIYVYIREMTNLNTKQITRSFNKLKPWYVKYKKRWQDGEI